MSRTKEARSKGSATRNRRRLDELNDKRTRRLWSTAYHEAGHAVAALLMHVPLKRATIKPRGDTLGHVRRDRVKFGVPPMEIEAGGPPPRARDKMERDIVMKFAGFHAERHYTGRRNRIGASHDWHGAVNRAGYIVSGGQGA